MPEFFRPEMPDFTITEHQPLIDSSDMTPDDWQCIADDIKAQYDHYMMVSLSCMVRIPWRSPHQRSFMFENLTKPVIVTGSQIPL